MLAEISSTAELEYHQVCIVYQRRSGKIVHVHEVLTLRGGETPTNEQVEARAVELAATKLKDRAALATLHVDPATLRPGIVYKVNVKARKLVEGKVRSRQN